MPMVYENIAAEDVVPVMGDVPTPGESMADTVLIVAAEIREKRAAEAVADEGQLGFLAKRRARRWKSL
jgi:hypothetical protein